MAEMTAGLRRSRTPRRRTRRWPQSGGLQPPPGTCRVVTAWKCPTAVLPAPPAPRAPPCGLPPGQGSEVTTTSRLLLLRAETPTSTNTRAVAGRAAGLFPQEGLRLCGEEPQIRRTYFFPGCERVNAELTQPSTPNDVLHRFQPWRTRPELLRKPDAGSKKRESEPNSSRHIFIILVFFFCPDGDNCIIARCSAQPFPPRS
nr:uncharacterized protein LOC110365993 [Columba livia]